MTEHSGMRADTYAKGVFEVDPWKILVTRLDLDRLAQSESIFALSNGHLGIRGTLDEGEPSSLVRDSSRTP
jgi:trehalose/maltose hydrolase-like predicted phosphorylase